MAISKFPLPVSSTTRHHGREHRQARLAQNQPHHLKARRAERQELQPELSRYLTDGGERDPGHDRRGDDRLGGDDGGRRIENLEIPEGAAAPQQQGDEEPDHDRRQSHTGVHRAHDETAAGKSREREPRAGRNAQGERDHGRDSRDLEREPQDPPDLTVGSGE